MEFEDETLPTRLDRTVIYECKWVNLYRDRVALPTGHILEQYHLLDFGRGAVIAIVENERGEILMERIARYPTGMVTWELPSGGIEGDESILNAAAREVFEETGYETHAHAEVYQFNPLTGISNMRAYIVRCRAGVKSGELDQNEIMAARWFSSQELRSMIKRGETSDGFALIGLLLYFDGKE